MDAEKIKSYILANYKKIFRQPAANIKYPFLCPGAGYAQELWGWDAYWEAFLCAMPLKITSKR